MWIDSWTLLEIYETRASFLRLVALLCDVWESLSLPEEWCHDWFGWVFDTVMHWGRR